MVFFCRGAKSVRQIDQEGPKSLLFNKFTVLSLLFLPSRGAKLHCQFRWGPWPDLPPLDPPLIAAYMYIVSELVNNKKNCCQCYHEASITVAVDR